jgi:hypothetical protein
MFDLGLRADVFDLYGATWSVKSTRRHLVFGLTIRIPLINLLTLLLFYFNYPHFFFFNITCSFSIFFNCNIIFKIINK